MTIEELRRIGLNLQKAAENLRESPLIKQAEEIRKFSLYQNKRLQPLVKHLEEIREAGLGIQRLGVDSKALVAGARVAAHSGRLIAVAVRQREANRRKRPKDRHFFRVSDNQGGLFYPEII